MRSWQATGQTLQGQPPEVIRAQIVQIASNLTGLGAMETPDEYALAIGCDLEGAAFRATYVPTAPLNDPLWKESSCGLFVRSVLRHAGCSHPRLKSPYVPGFVMEDLEATARDCGAWNTHTPTDAGNPIMYGAPVGAKSGQHVAIPVKNPDPSYVEIAGGAGGGDGAGTEIKLATRTICVSSDGRMAAKSAGGVRYIRAWIDAAKLPFKNELFLVQNTP